MCIAALSVKFCLQTPLGERWSHLIPKDKQFTPRIILQTAARRNQPVIGFSERYLDRVCADWFSH